MAGYRSKADVLSGLVASLGSGAVDCLGIWTPGKKGDQEC